ncbi:hypothetical protein [Porphyromonas sp.]|uniref:hypothetical protein n=1 Tax=Porphyromonas sp. TaxID=1924944 RepID=UPI0026DD3CB4|nr:hypothetical protein [Porphyromonas sp.]MDO4770760.1 hypothetical protein [Porphyromonas sp.]
MRVDELHNIIRGKATIDETQLSDLIALSTRYPYSASLHTIILLGLYKTQDLRFASELQRRSLYIPDLAKLFFVLKGDDHAMLQPHAQSEEIQSSNAFDIIDTFLSEHPDDSSSDVEQLFSPQENDSLSLSEDYFTWIEDHVPTTQTTEKEDTMTLISNFLNKGKEAEQLKSLEQQPETPLSKQSPKQGVESPPEEELLTETLARIYIKQGKYDNALRIIKSLNLNNPKKSSYFAEQIDFLEKLILNS